MAKGKSKHDTPSQLRYKQDGHLRKNKIRRIMKDQGVDAKTAESMWEESKKVKAVTTKRK